MTDRPYDVVALDLDGTTVRSDGRIGERTQAALRRVEAAGAMVIAVTGRPPRWMPPILDALCPDGDCPGALAICANGAVVMNLATGEIVSERLLDAATARDVMRALSAAIDGLSFAVERSGDGGFVHEPNYRPRWVGGEFELSSYDELPAQPVRKLLARHDQLPPDELLARARAAVGAEVAELTHSSVDALLEISAVGVSKATTLEAVCAQSGIGAERVIAFGDMPNDVPMLAWAGHAVAVANAHREVIAVADEVTGSNDDEGVADVLERLWPTD